MFHFEELDTETRGYMLEEIMNDLNEVRIYFSKQMTDAGKAVYVGYLKDAVMNGTEGSLADALNSPTFWESHHVYLRKGKPVRAKVPVNAHIRLAEGEFNVYYMRGLCRKLLAEGINEAELYRAKEVTNPRSGERWNPGDVVQCEEALNDLREREEGESKLGIPRGPMSGLSLRRIPNSKG